MSYVAECAARAVRARSMAAQSPKFGYHWGYWHKAARDDEMLIRLYANAIERGHLDSRIVQRFEASA